MKASYTNGNGFFGVNNGGKHSVDVTYIAKAQATGRVTVESLHNVTSIEQTSTGRWRVHVDRTDVQGRVLEQKLITTDTLILAAGCVNTTKMLMRARYRGAIRNLPDRVGKDWGTNGDRIVVWTDLAEDFGRTQGGPVVFGSKEWDDPAMANTVIQASIPPLPVSPHSTITVGFGVSPVRAAWTYNPLLDDIVLNWPREGDHVLHQRIWERMTAIAGPRGLLVDTHTPLPMTWHPLGGACMETVCDLYGRVHGHPGLYVLDGALMPGTTGACNPSMTIAAIAEHAMDEIVAREVGVTI
jgi:cholesterol oxidase